MDEAQEYMLRRASWRAAFVIVCALFALAGVWLRVVCRCLPQLAFPLVEMCMLGRGMEPLVRASPAQHHWFLSAVSRGSSRLVTDSRPKPRFILTGNDRDMRRAIGCLPDKLCLARWPPTLCQFLRGACCARNMRVNVTQRRIRRGHRRPGRRRRRQRRRGGRDCGARAACRA